MTNLASGGFSPTLKTVSDGVTAEASIFASEHKISKRAGITLAAGSVGADANGDKILRAGTVIGEFTSGDYEGLYGAYNNSHSDGTETAVGILPQTVNLRDGDVVSDLVLHGSFIESRLSGLDSNAKTDLAGRMIWQ